MVRAPLVVLSALTLAACASAPTPNDYRPGVHPPQAFSALQPGMSEHDVVRAIGEPHRRSISQYGPMTCLFYPTVQFNAIAQQMMHGEQVITFRRGRLVSSMLAITTNCG